MLKSGIYKILNLITGRVYVGSSYYLNKRFGAHVRCLIRQTHKNKYLQASWNLHGEAAFEFIVLEYCEKEALTAKEQYWIDTLNCVTPNGYNILPAANSMLGYKQSKEHIEKRIGSRVYTPLSDETKELIRKANLGKKLSPETCAKFSAVKKGKQYRLGAKATEETKLKLSKAGKKRYELVITSTPLVMGVDF